uniref:2-oxoglutarate-dependent dioxygenase DAO n=1 Tax=Kalanchoe fedtschenkoi TaxID=63787 RepID=A0A7N0VLN4_KALFE
MGSIGADAQIPTIDFSAEAASSLLSGSDSDINIRRQVRAALEGGGIFFLRCSESSTQSLLEEMVIGMKSLFDLPEDVKRRYKSIRPYSSYKGREPIAPLHESFAIDDAYLLESAQAFARVFWPEGNQQVSSALNNINKMMLDLIYAILKVIFESYGAENRYELFVEKTVTSFRLLKYNLPPAGEAVGLVPHTDKNLLTMLCQNDVQGLEILSKDGIWSPLVIPQGCFVVMIGDSLKAWSNGRMRAARHKVMISGDRDRYSCGLFILPKKDVIIEVPDELVDDDHPLLYKPYNYTDYINYFVGNLKDDALETFAGV